MATAKTGVVKVSGMTITDNGTKSVKVSGTGSTKLSMGKSDGINIMKLTANKTTYLIEDYKQIFTSNRASVSLFGSAATGFDATNDRYSAVKVIDATAMGSAVSLKGNDNANQIIAGASGATLDGGKGNDTLTGGKGADLFVYSAGNDIIKSFTAKNDSISVDGSAIADASISGKNIILKVDSKNTLTVEGMASKELAFTDSDGDKTLKAGIFYDSDSNAIVSNAFTKTAKTTVDATNIDASAASKAVNLVGNSSANSIVGGAKNDTLNGAAGADTIDGGKGNDKLYGGAGDDLIYCGAGNDSLWGDAGANTFIYAKGDGKDVIFGFTSDDTLTLEDISFTAAKVNSKGTEVALTLGSGSLTFKSFESGTDFHIGSDTYQVVQSGKKYSFEKTE